MTQVIDVRLNESPISVGISGETEATNSHEHQPVTIRGMILHGTYLQCGSLIPRGRTTTVLNERLSSWQVNHRICVRDARKTALGKMGLKLVLLYLSMYMYNPFNQSS